MIAGVGLEPNHVWAPCCKTWLWEKKWKVNLQLLRKKKNEVRGFYLLGSYPLVGRHVVNEPKVGCHVVNKPWKLQVGL